MFILLRVNGVLLNYGTVELDNGLSSEFEVSLVRVSHYDILLRLPSHFLLALIQNVAFDGELNWWHLVQLGIRFERLVVIQTCI